MDYVKLAQELEKAANLANSCHEFGVNIIIEVTQRGFSIRAVKRVGDDVIQSLRLAPFEHVFASDGKVLAYWVDTAFRDIVGATRRKQ